MVDNSRAGAGRNCVLHPMYFGCEFPSLSQNLIYPEQPQHLGVGFLDDVKMDDAKIVVSLNLSALAFVLQCSGQAKLLQFF